MARDRRRTAGARAVARSQAMAGFPAPIGEEASTTDKAKAKAKEVGEKAKELGSQTVDKTKDVARKTGAKAKDVGGKAADGAKSLWGKAKTKVTKSGAPMSASSPHAHLDNPHHFYKYEYELHDGTRYFTNARLF